jgi:hypothetical protein
MNKYTELLEYCSTDRQREVISKVIEFNSPKKATEDLEINERNVFRMIYSIKRRMDAVEGSTRLSTYPEIPDYFAVSKFHVMTLTDPETGEKTERVRNVSAKPDDAKRLKIFLDFLNDKTAHLHTYYKKIKPPKKTIKNLITNYKTTDLHFGALMWHEETGHDYDLNIARDTLLSASKYLIEQSPNTEKCIISDTGDMVEADDFSNMTKRSGNILDVDGRYPKVLRVVRDTFIELIHMALEKHKKVVVIFTKGNHDDMTSFFIQEYLHGYFRNEKRVTIDNSLKPRKYYLHGNTLLGYTHGHEMKPHQCGEVMAHECREHFHKTLHRYFDFGHVHKDSSGENVICKWETHKNLPPSNAWATGMGYLNQLGTMKAVVYCKDHGEQDRMTFSVSRMQEVEATEFDSMILN